MGAKGKGTIAYFDADSDDQYVAVTCLLELTPGGYSRGVVETDACLGDTFVTSDSGDLKLTPVTGRIEYNANATFEAGLETAIKNDTEIQFAIKIPLGTPVYRYYVGKLTEFSPDPITRDRKMAASFSFLPTAIPSDSGTAPTAES